MPKSKKYNQCTENNPQKGHSLDKNKKNKSKKSSTKKIQVKPLFLGLIISISALLITAAIVFLLQSNKIVWGMSLWEANVGGLTIEKAQEKINTDLSTKLASKQITISFNNEITHTLSAQELGITIDSKASLENAYKIGKNKEIVQEMWERLSFLYDREANVVLNIDEDQFSKAMIEYFGTAEKEKTEPRLNWQDSTLTIQPGNPGYIINKDDLKTVILENIENDQIEAGLNLKIIPISTDIQKLERIQSSIQEFVDKPLILVADDMRWEIDHNQKKEWINPDYLENKSAYKLNQESITTFLENINKDFTRDPKNPFASRNEDGSLTSITPHQDGRSLNPKKNLDIILERALGNSQINLEITSIPASINSTQINTLNLPDLLGTANTGFSGSSRSRVNNVTIGASKVNGYLLAPDQEFSFINMVTVSYEEGFQNAPVIVNGKVEPGLGGGICQVSSTLFQATMHAGLKITERWPHSFAIGRYGIGSDATIARPVKDFKFKNNTQNPILITNYIKGSRIYFDIFGIYDGREVKVIGPSVYQVTSGGITKAQYTQEVYKNENLEYSDTFKSSYSPH